MVTIIKFPSNEPVLCGSVISYSINQKMHEGNNLYMSKTFVLIEGIAACKTHIASYETNSEILKIVKESLIKNFNLNP